jgi:hypothetical protein
LEGIPIGNDSGLLGNWLEKILGDFEARIACWIIFILDISVLDGFV